MKTIIIYLVFPFLALCSCNNISKPNEQEKVLSPEEEFKIKVTGQWYVKGLFSDTQIAFLPNGKGFHIFTLDTRTGKILSHKEFPKWTIKKGYYLFERAEFFYVEVDNTQYYYVDRKSKYQLITPYGGKRYYTTGNGELQFTTSLDIEKTYADGSIYDKVDEKTAP